MQMEDKKSFMYLALQAELIRQTVGNRGSLWETH